MATQNKIQPYYAGSSINQSPVFRGGPEYPHFKETASQSYKVGDLIYIDSNGTIAICTNSSTLLNSAIAGQATLNATGTTGANVHFRVIRPDDLFIMNVYHATPASAVTAQTQLGVSYGLIVISNKWHVDINNTTIEDGSTALGKVQVVDFPLKHPDGTACVIGDTYGLVLVKFLPFTIATDGSPMTRNLQLG